jgi:hypothetical protein
MNTLRIDLRRMSVYAIASRASMSRLDRQHPLLIESYRGTEKPNWYFCESGELGMIQYALMLIAFIITLGIRTVSAQTCDPQFIPIDGGSSSCDGGLPVIYACPIVCTPVPCASDAGNMSIPDAGICESCVEQCPPNVSTNP